MRYFLLLLVVLTCGCEEPRRRSSRAEGPEIRYVYVQPDDCEYYVLEKSPTPTRYKVLKLSAREASLLQEVFGAELRGPYKELNQAMRRSVWINGGWPDPKEKQPPVMLIDPRVSE